MMKRVFSFGKIDYYHTGRKINLVEVEMSYTEKGDKKVFSVSGKIWNGRKTDIVCGGQCLDEIAKYVKTPLFNTIFRLWKQYHLNDSHPECEHQARMHWPEKANEEVALYHWRLTREASDLKNYVEKAAIAALRAGETFTPTPEQTHIASLNYSLTTSTPTPPENISQYYEPKKPFYAGDEGHVEKRRLGCLREDEHPDGILGKPCPVCGYRYGTYWNYFPVPRDDEQIILNLLKGEQP